MHTKMHIFKLNINSFFPVSVKYTWFPLSFDKDVSSDLLINRYQWLDNIYIFEAIL